MSTALVSSACYNFGDALYKHQNSSVIAATHKTVPLERRYSGPSTVTSRRNSTSNVPLISPKATTAMHPKPPAANGIAIPSSSVLLREHRKLDRSLSEPVDCRASAQQQQQPRPASGGGQAGNSSRYKTELCRPFEENGTCKYGDKCQFAHGSKELRSLVRHPKYKTELCRTFHTTGFCPYGPRCHFIHNSEESKKSLLSNLQAQSPSPPPPQQVSCRPKALSVGSFSIGSAGELSPPSSQSGSPTSLSSFFGEDAFVLSPTTPSSIAGGNAFPFPSQELIAPLKQPLQLPASYGTGSPLGGASPPPPPYLPSDLSEAVATARDTLFSTFSGIEAAPALIPAPPSPVDSHCSEMDIFSTGFGAPASVAPPPPPSAIVSSAAAVVPNSPTDGRRHGKNRLPIFARIVKPGDSE